MSQSILRLPQVKARTGLSRSLIYLFIKEGKFPKQVSLGDRAVGWPDGEIDRWVEDRIHESRQECA